MRTLPGASSFAPTRAAAAKEVPRFNHQPGRCTSIYRAKHTTKEKENTKATIKRTTHLPIKSGYPPHIWTPNLLVLLDSHACLRKSAHSRRSPANKFDAIAISDIVTSAPNFTHKRRNGACPTVVNGAKINFLLKLIAFFSVFSSFSFSFASSFRFSLFIAAIFLFFVLDTHNKSHRTFSKYFVDLGKRYVDSRNSFCNRSSMVLNSSLPSLRLHSSKVFVSFDDERSFSCRS